MISLHPKRILFYDQPMTMKFLLIPFACLLMNQICLADETEEKVMKEAQKCADATVAKDWDRAVAFMPASFIEKAGGKEKLKEELKQAELQMAAKGLTITKVVIGKPVQTKDIKNTIYSMVPQTTTLKVPDGVLTHKAYLLGVSKDGGASWCFLDCSLLDGKNMMEMFPDAAGEISIPKKEMPVLEKK
jgi:hypothetical protein